MLAGTTETVVVPILEKESGKKCGEDFTVCYNPEFMREGSAVADFLNPPYTILGASDTRHLAPLREQPPGRSLKIDSVRRDRLVPKLQFRNAVSRSSASFQYGRKPLTTPPD